MNTFKLFLASTISFVTFLGIPPSSYAGTCVETSPGVDKCWPNNGSSSTTVETSPGVFRYYGTDSEGNYKTGTYIQW